ncbi:MAG: hypothetical protein QXK37_06050 [Candidatus Woesearchaeota archaeon]
MKKYTALILCWLIISLPVYSSIAFANKGSISDLEVYGKNQVPSALEKYSENLQVKAKVVMTTDNGLTKLPITKNNIKLTVSGYEESFTNCTDIEGNEYLCQYKGPKRDWVADKYTVSVKLYDDYFVRLAQSDLTFFIDEKPPEITGFTVKNEGTSGISIQYDIKDSACERCGALCAGLSSMNIQINNETKKVVNISDCFASGSLTASFSELGVSEGKKELCLVVSDKFNHTAKSCRTFGIDYSPPLMLEPTLKIVDLEGNEVTYGTTLALDAKIVANITEDLSGLVINTAVANLSALNTIQPEAYQNVKGTCSEKEEGKYYCEWAFVMDNPTQSPIMIFLEDNSGNNKTYSKTFNLPLDKTRPNIISISGRYGKFLKKNNNSIILEIAETGSGMGKADATLNLYEANPALYLYKASECANEGSWKCYFKGFDVTGKVTGDQIGVSVAELRDDSGNTYDPSSVSREIFIYDEISPKFLNITIISFGTGLDVLTLNDVAEIKAIIKENESGLSPANVLADLSIFNSTLMPATECTARNDSTYECKWQYSGSFKKGQVKLRVIATDNAGNSRDSAQDNKYGVTYVVDVKQQRVDWWQDSMQVAQIAPMNRNFIWMSPNGAIERVELSLVPKNSGSKYVHSLNINQCKGTLKTDNKEYYDPFPIKAQYYFPGHDKTSKYIILNIPNYDKNLTATAKSVKVVCEGDIVQSAGRSSDIISPNEKVNASFEIKLLAGIFEAPDSAAIDKINEKQATLNTINSILDSIKWLTDILRPLCTLFSTIRQIFAGICLIINGVEMEFFGAVRPSSCILQSDLLESIWYGKQKMIKAPDSATGTVPARGTFLSPGTNPIKLSSKDILSLGFVCDLVLCEDCSTFWKGSIQGISGVNLDKWTTDKLYGHLPFGPGVSGFDISKKAVTDSKSLSPVEKARSSGTYYANLYFNPKKSLVTAVLCFPPCLTGIETKLNVYKQIIITYNACVNVATIRGADISDCEVYLSSQICQQIIGEFWYIIDDFIKQFIVKYALFIFEQKILNLDQCTQIYINGGVATGGIVATCLPARIYRIAGIFLTLSDTIQQIDSLIHHEWFNGNDNANQVAAENHLNQELNKDSKGSFPKYQ